MFCGQAGMDNGSVSPRSHAQVAGSQMSRIARVSNPASSEKKPAQGLPPKTHVR